MTPRLGRIVLYTDGNDKTMPAMITEVSGETVSLTLFKPHETTYATCVKFSETPMKFHWTWREGEG